MGSLLIAVATIGVSIVVWSETPAWLANGVPHAAPQGASRPAARASEAPRVPVPPAPPATDSPTLDGDRVGASAAPPVSPPVPAVVPPSAPAAKAPAAPAAATAPARAAATAGDPLSGVGEALDAYRRAFDTLDAASVTAIWPGADVGTLAGRFSELRYQHLSFDRCQTRATAADRALVSCVGSISDVPSSGDPTLRRRRASWTIALRRAAGRWTIDSLSTS